MHDPDLRNAAVKSVLDKACGNMVYIKVVLEHMAAVGEVRRGGTCTRGKERNTERKSVCVRARVCVCVCVHMRVSVCVYVLACLRMHVHVADGHTPPPSSQLHAHT